MQGLSCKVVGRLDVLDRIFGAVFDFYVRDGMVVIRMRILRLRWWTGRVVFLSSPNWSGMMMMMIRLNVLL